MAIWWWVGLGIIAAALSAVLWWWGPKWQMRSITAPGPKERADIEDNFRKTIGQAVGGIIAAFVAAGFTYTQFLQQQKATEAQQASAREQLSADQMVKGLELLGNTIILQRLGGIYTLGVVINGSSLYSQPALETLCAFIRDGTIGMIVGEEPSTDIQAALTVIGRRAAEPGRVDLANANLSRANLSRANLSRANLNGADLIGANLSDAYLNDANVNGANLIGAKGISQSQLDQACGVDVRLPPGLTVKPCPLRP
jgi:hypothetical protein